MIEVLKDVDLGNHTVLLLLAHHILVYYFNRTFSLCSQVHTFSDLSVATGTDHLSDLIIIPDVLVLVKMIEHENWCPHRFPMFRTAYVSGYTKSILLGLTLSIDVNLIAL